MGLDMYLEKAKRIDGATTRDYDIVNNYFSWKNRSEKNKNISMKRYCGVASTEVNKKIAEALNSEYKHRYAIWDEEKKYGWESIFQVIAYWRKANAIHGWFVEHVQSGLDDCDRYEVTEDDLELLLYTCKLVKKKSRLVKNGNAKYIADSRTARKLLPATSGFFFGSTDYDEWYMLDLNETISQLERILRETDFEHEIVFYSSSW